MRFEAGVHGIKLDGGSKKGKSKDDEEGWLCVDPKDYEHLPKKERENLTKERMKKFNSIAK